MRFVTASNTRERVTLDVLVARDGLFHWFTIDDRDPRRSVGFYERERLVRYLVGRRGGAVFRLLSFAFNGRSGGYGHFEFRLALTAVGARALQR